MEGRTGPIEVAEYFVDLTRLLESTGSVLAQVDELQQWIAGAMNELSGRYKEEGHDRASV